MQNLQKQGEKERGVRSVKGNGNLTRRKKHEKGGSKVKSD